MGNNLYAIYKKYSYRDALLCRSSFKSNKDRWNDLAKELEKNNVTAEEFMSFLFSTVNRPFLNVVFKKENGEYKYLKKYLQFVKSGRQAKTLPKETKEEFLKEIQSMRINVTIEYTEILIRKNGIPKLEDYANSIYSMLFEYSPAYLSYLVKEGHYDNYEPDNFDWGYYNLLLSNYFEQYFSLVETVQQLSDEGLKERYEMDYKKYMHKRGVLGDHVLEPSIELLGSTGDGYVYSI